MPLPVNPVLESAAGPFPSWLHRILERPAWPSDQTNAVWWGYSPLGCGEDHAVAGGTDHREGGSLLDHRGRRKVRLHDQMVAFPPMAGRRRSFPRENPVRPDRGKAPLSSGIKG